MDLEHWPWAWFFGFHVSFGFRGIYGFSNPGHTNQSSLTRNHNFCSQSSPLFCLKNTQPLELWRCTVLINLPSIQGTPPSFFPVVLIEIITVMPTFSHDTTPRFVGGWGCSFIVGQSIVGWGGGYGLSGQLSRQLNMGGSCGWLLVLK